METKAMLYPKRSKEKSPRVAMRTPAAVNITERATWNLKENYVYKDVSAPERKRIKCYQSL